MEGFERRKGRGCGEDLEVRTWVIIWFCISLGRVVKVGLMVVAREDEEFL